MRIITIAGPPSCGKTSVVLRLAPLLREAFGKVAVVKYDCLTSTDNELYLAASIEAFTGISANMCPDHYYVSNVERGISWANAHGAAVLVNESAGLCNRCSPHIKGVPAVCVVDCLSGSRTPSKIGPMLRLADFVAITKGDIVSQAEREVFASEVRKANPQARVVFVNGITGQGAHILARFLSSFDEPDSQAEMRLRFTMPSALCSYCMGQTLVGKDYQMGAMREMETGL